MVCYAEKEEKPFLVKFARPNESIWDHKICCVLLRTILVSSCGLKKKKRVTIIVAFHFMQRRLKMTDINIGVTIARLTWLEKSSLGDVD